MAALVDVIIPVFNGADFLEDAVRSIQNQSVSDLNIIIVDDGSTDASPDILAAIAAEDARVRVLTTPNRGIVDALNLALEHGSAPFIARHDADDIAYPHRFAAQLAHFERHPECVAQSATVRHIDEAGRPVGTFGRMARSAVGDARHIPAIEPYLIHPFLMVRRSALVAAGGYRHVFHAEDTDLYWRLLDQGRLVNLDEVLGDYRLHGGSISGGSLANGRIMALSSQLSALSYLRRQDGRPDMAYDKADIARLKAASGSLEQLFELARPKLEPDEQARLRMALGAKLLELTGYRPYEVVLGDCTFLRAAARESLRVARGRNRQLLIRRYSGTAARLVSTGHLEEARALLWPALLPPTLYRLGLRFAFPPGFRASFNKLVRLRLERVRSFGRRTLPRRSA